MLPLVIPVNSCDAVYLHKSDVWYLAAHMHPKNEVDEGMLGLRVQHIYSGIPVVVSCFHSSSMPIIFGSTAKSSSLCLA